MKDWFEDEDLYALIKGLLIFMVVGAMLGVIYLVIALWRYV